MALLPTTAIQPSCDVIEWLSYSGLAKLRRCALSAAFTRDSMTRHWSRSSPSSCLGTARHQIVEEISLGLQRGLDAPSSRWISARFDFLLSEQEKKLAQDWAPATVPSTKRWCDVAYVRARLLRTFSGSGDAADNQWPSHDAARPEKKAGGVSGFHSPDRPQDGTVLSEVWLRDSEREFHGQVDQLLERDGSLVVVDLKSGVGADPATLLERYREQMLFYAGIVESTYGEWPVLEIISASDATIPVAYQPTEVDSLRSKAIEDRASFNEALEGQKLLKTCSASIETCAWCPFQVVCGPFQESWPDLAEVAPPNEIRSISLVGGPVESIDTHASSIDVHMKGAMGISDVGASVIVTRLPSALELTIGDTLVIAGIEAVNNGQVLPARWDSRIRVISGA